MSNAILSAHKIGDNICITALGYPSLQLFHIMLFLFSAYNKLHDSLIMLKLIDVDFFGFNKQLMNKL